MACAHDIERRIEGRLADGHWLLWRIAAAYCTTVAGLAVGVLMHLASYNIRGRSSFGVITRDGVIDLRPRFAPRLTSVLDVLRADALAEVQATVAGVRPDYPLTEVELLPPVPGGEKILCIGVNYANRDAELTGAGGNEDAKYPSMFFKPPNGLVAHGQPLLPPPAPGQLE